MATKKETFGKLGTALLNAKLKAGVSDGDKAIIEEIIAERKNGETAKKDKPAASSKKAKAALTPEEQAVADAAKAEAAAKTEEEKAEAAKKKAEAKEAADKAKAEAAQKKAEAKAAAAEAKEATKLAKQWKLKGIKANFTPFGGEDKVEGTIVGKMLDKRVMTILVKIEDADGKLFHKTVDKFTLVDATEEQAAALVALQAEQAGYKLGVDNSVEAIETKIVKTEATLVELKAKLEIAKAEEAKAKEGEATAESSENTAETAE